MTDNKNNDKKQGLNYGKGLAPDVRIAIVGNVDSGKSTLIGVLTGGDLDNGRGSARARIFVHRHEANSSIFSTNYTISRGSNSK